MSVYMSNLVNDQSIKGNCKKRFVIFMRLFETKCLGIELLRILSMLHLLLKLFSKIVQLIQSGILM